MILLAKVGGLPMKNDTPFKSSEDFHNFLLKMGANRVKADMELITMPICALPNIIVKYFKANNDRYLELIKMEYKNGS